jgi:alpha-amylase
MFSNRFLACFTIKGNASLLIFLPFLVSLSPGYSQQPGGGNANNPTKQIVLQGFWWDYWNHNYPNGWANYLTVLSPRLKDLGIDAVWIPPSIKNNSPSSVGYAPFDHYDLGDKFQKGNLKTRLGDKDELLRMVAVLKSNGIDVIQDLVLNHLANAGSQTGLGGQDPAAMDDGFTNKYKNFRYVAYSTPADNESATNYLNRVGRFSKNWQNFYPNPNNSCCTNDVNSPFWGPDIAFESNSVGLSSNATFNPVQAGNYMRDQMREWLVWYKKQMGWDGVRLDAVKHFPSFVTEDYLWNLQSNASWASQGSTMYAVGEWVGGANELDAWANSVQNRAGTFDFSLRNAITGIVSGNGNFDLGTAPSYQQGNRQRTVPFVNNHDTFKPQLNSQGNYSGWNTGQQLGQEVNPYDPRHSLVHALILSVDGSPQIFFEDLFDIGQLGNRWTHYPNNPASLPVRSDIANLLWCHQNLRFKDGAYLVRWQAADALVIERGAKALICMNDHYNDWQNLQGVQTSWPDGTVLQDYSGASTITQTVYNGGKVNLLIPPCNGTAGQGRKGYSVWAPVNSSVNYLRPAKKTTQEWEMDNDLGDSHTSSLQQGGKTPSQSLACRVVGRVYLEKDSIFTLETYLGLPNASVNLDVLDQNCRLLAQYLVSSGHSSTYVPTRTGWHTVRISNSNSSQAGLKAWIKATYSAPKVVSVNEPKELCSCLGTGSVNLNLKYLQPLGSPIANRDFSLFIGQELVLNGVTNSLGSFAQNNLIAGTYWFQPGNSFTWGGVNQTDALLANQAFAQTTVLTNLQWKAADVNLTQIVNSTDALLIARRFAGLLGGFAAGDWVFDSKSFNLSQGSNQVTTTILCTGDVNGSHSP